MTIPAKPVSQGRLEPTGRRIGPARHLPLMTLLAGLNGCAVFHPTPCPEDLARLPVVEFSKMPPPGDFILKLPAGKAIPVRVTVKGSLLTESVDQTLNTTIVRDLYLHKEWASWDGQDWHSATDLVGADLTLALPSDAHPKPGEITLTVDRKDRP